MTDEIEAMLAENRRLKNELVVVSKEYHEIKKASQEVIDGIIYKIHNQIIEDLNN